MPTGVRLLFQVSGKPLQLGGLRETEHPPRRGARQADDVNSAPGRAVCAGGFRMDSVTRILRALQQL